MRAHEPASLWNDSIWELDFDGFRVLSLNDAGLNYRLARTIRRPHLLMSSFSPGASGYPATWTHLDDEQNTLPQDYYEDLPASWSQIHATTSSSASHGKPTHFPQRMWRVRKVCGSRSWARARSVSTTIAPIGPRARGSSGRPAPPIHSSAPAGL